MYTIELPIENPVLVFAIAMIIILLAPMAFQRIRIPGIVGIIVTGALIGPSALGLLERSETFILLGTVGLIYLMFTAGITLDLNQFTRSEEHTSELQSRGHLVCRLLLEKKKNKRISTTHSKSR